MLNNEVGAQEVVAIALRCTHLIVDIGERFHQVSVPEVTQRLVKLDLATTSRSPGIL